MLRAIVTGGGIGGLATGLALKNAGITSTVFERSPIIREVGAGLAIWSNGVRALQALGIGKQVIAEASVIREIITFTDTSRELTRMDMSRLAATGAPNICVPRGKLQRILYRALGEEHVQTGKVCTGVEQSAEGVRARLDDGSVVEADFLVAVDGIHSVIRKQMHPAAALRKDGCFAWRGLASRRPDAGETIVWPTGEDWLILGRGVQAAFCECGPELLFWYVCIKGRAGSQVTPDERKKRLLKIAAGWPLLPRRVLEATAGEGILENDLVYLNPIPDWGKGRVTFAGDAIHATLPHLGQGAALAMEDAVVLGRCLRAGRPIEESLREYERLRQRRTSWVVHESRKTGLVLQVRNPLLVNLRNAFITTRLARRMGERLFQRSLSFE